MSTSGRRGWPPLAAGLVLLAALAALRLCCTADEQQTWFLGQSFGAACYIRTHFGIPCPDCGMTRAAILAAHCAWLRAWRIAPGGPAVILAAFLSALSVILLGATRLCGASSQIERAERCTPRVIYASAILAALIWFLGWVAALVRR